MDILACPVCKGPLTLSVNTQAGEDITSGALRCTKCSESYPIADGIPDLLPPEYRDKPVSSLPGAN